MTGVDIPRFGLGQPVVVQRSPGYNVRVRLTDDARKCVLFFEGPDPKKQGEYVPSGTGFLVVHRDGGIEHRYLVTAAHVARRCDADRVRLRGNNRDGGGGIDELEEFKWVYHKDSKVDVAVGEYEPPDNFDAMYYPTCGFVTDAVRLEIKNVGAGSMIHVVALWNFHSGDQRVVPIVHTGNIALEPGDLIRQYVRRSDEVIHVNGYLVEAQAIAGASGAPVFVRRSLRVPGLQNPHLTYSPVFLLGVWVGSWKAPPDETLARARAIEGRVEVPVGMGIVMPADRILEILNYDELAEGRRSRIRAHDMSLAATPDASA